MGTPIAKSKRARALWFAGGDKTMISKCKQKCDKENKMKQAKTLVLAIAILALMVPVGALGAQGQARNGQGNQGNCLFSSATMNTPLSQDAIDWLRYMREEEKLARDVYKNLYAQWGLLVFDKISQSEERHFAAIKTLLDRYGIDDPAAGNGAGVFDNSTLQALYNELMAKGILSIVDALQVGVEIEKTDIDDLKAASNSTQNRDILRVYTNLLQGSYNHLDAFESHLQASGNQP